jgi:hypothetical protein
MIGAEGDFQVTHNLVVGVLRRRLFIRVRRIGKIFRLANRKRQPPRGSGGANLMTKSVAMAGSLFRIDQDEVIQGGSRT